MTALPEGAGPREPPRFIADAMLGRLVRWLRILGYDTVYDAGLSDAEIARRALREGRIVLTRDRGLAARRAAAGAVLLGSEDWGAQLRQVRRELGISPDPALLFTRCPRCNGLVEPAGSESVRGDVPEYVLASCERFSRCPGCRRVFWRGTHHARIADRIRELFQEGG